MTLQLFQVDAFTDRLFGGNPAAIVPLESWLDEALMQAIAAENNLAETAFFVPEPAGSEADYHLRWFTPTVEVDLCGHATLASAWLLFQELDFAGEVVRFSSRSGVLAARRTDNGVTIDLPARASEPVDCPQDLTAGLGVQPQAVRGGANLIAIFESEAQVRALQPDFSVLARLHPLGVIVTAPGDEVDVVSRYFAPSFGINEDPVTGSAHADLAPYWCERLERNAFSARQISARRGEIAVLMKKERVHLTGHCRLYLKGQLSY